MYKRQVQYYLNRYHKAMEALNVLPPSIEPHASGHIIEQIELVEEILKQTVYVSINPQNHPIMNRFENKIIIITSGTTPSMNGIISQRWMDASTLRPVNSTDDTEFMEGVVPL